MIDYFAHYAILESLGDEFSAASLSDPNQIALRDQVLAAVSTQHDAAILGSVIDHVLTNAASDGTELALLETAADQWQRGLAINATLTQSRDEVEHALLNPSAPGSVAIFNSGIARLWPLKQQVSALAAEVDTLRKALHPLPHLPVHPRQTDSRAGEWSYGNLHLGRRTDAFVRSTFDRRRDDETTAFAFGVLCSYAGNAAGSAYLGHAVGGPRRSQRFRDRLARNTVGAWFRQNTTEPTPVQLASRMRFGAPGFPARFPPAIAQQLSDALTDAFPPGTTASPPDFDLGLVRTVRQLELLGQFSRPPKPAPPAGVLAARGAAVAGELSVHIKDAGFSTDGGGGSTGGGTGTTGADSNTSKSAGCGFLGLLIVVALVFLIDCVVQLVEDGTCKPAKTWDKIKGHEEPPTASDSAALTAIASSDAGAHLAQDTFELQMMLWNGMGEAFEYLSLIGLIYPDELLMDSFLYTQFLALPARAAWPYRQEVDSTDTYQADPVSPIEHPAVTPSPFPTGASPSILVQTHPQQEWSYPGEVAKRVLGEIANGAPLDAPNLDLDADRGFSHPCWAVTPGKSINEDPLAVQILSSTEI